MRRNDRQSIVIPDVANVLVIPDVANVLVILDVATQCSIVIPDEAKRSSGIYAKKPLVFSR
jgi:hypothetical protein